MLLKRHNGDSHIRTTFYERIRLALPNTDSSGQRLYGKWQARFARMCNDGKGVSPIRSAPNACR